MTWMLTACVLLFVAPALAQDKKDDKKPQPKGEPVSGTIAFNGKPLPGGLVTFASKDGKVKVEVLIGEDGKYKTVVPVGEYRLAVSTELPKKKDDPKDPKKDPPKKLPPIPRKYADLDTSGLTVEIKPGKQSFNIELSN